ncbi:MAG: tetratricopeptide repeat protein [Candidatus Aureabacteria bacterium]|nr:tetratricopeptide repeat protein [Candidatus Auribacterota bacterium]
MTRLLLLCTTATILTGQAPSQSPIIPPRETAPAAQELRESPSVPPSLTPGTTPTVPSGSQENAPTGSLLKEGEKILRQKKFDEAITQFNKVLALDPKNAIAYNDIGLCLYGQNKLDPAIESFKKAVELDPGLSSTYYNLGLCYASKKQWDLAVIEYKKAIKDNPKHERAQFELGTAYFAKQDLKKAKEQYEEAAKVLGVNTPGGEEALRNAIKMEMLMQRIPSLSGGQAPAAPPRQNRNKLPSQGEGTKRHTPL